MIFVIAIGISIFFFCSEVLIFGKKIERNEKVNQRLDKLSWEVSQAYRFRDDELAKPFIERIIRPTIHRLTTLLSNIIPSQNENSTVVVNTRKMLQQAGWTITVDEYMVLQSVLMLAGASAGLFLAFISRENLLNKVLYFFAGAFIPYALLRYICTSAGTQRKKSMEKQLPDMLDLLSVSVAAGLGFERAMLHIVETMDGPLIDEFAVTYREMTMGRSRKDALTLLGERCGVDDLSSVTGALVQAAQLGIPIRNVLETQSAAIRRTRRSKVQEKAAKVSTKILLPMVGFIFPVLFIVLLGPSLITIVEQFG